MQPLADARMRSQLVPLDLGGEHAVVRRAASLQLVEGLEDAPRPPLVRGLTGREAGAAGPPVGRAGEVASKAAKEAVNLVTPGEEVDFDKLLRYGLESAGYMVGLPTGQAVVTMRGLMDLIDGETSDPTRLMFRAPREDED